MTTDNPYAYVDVGWDFFASVDPREYFARLRGHVNPQRATPFLSDFQLRGSFKNVVVKGDRL